MNLVKGRIVEIYIEGGIARARVNVGGALTRVVMTFLMDARVGDEILVDSGVAISTVQPIAGEELGHVLSDSR